MVHARSRLLCVLGMLSVLFSCGGESPTETDEYKELEQELARAHEDLTSSQQQAQSLKEELAQSDQISAEQERELHYAQEALDVVRERLGERLDVVLERLDDLVVRDLVNGRLIIPPREWRRYSVRVEDWMLSPAIELEFEVVSGRDIEVMVFEDIPYKNWKAGVGGQKALYFKGRIAAGAKTVRLPGPGTYHVVVSNLFSIFTTKTVAITARFTARIEI